MNFVGCSRRGPSARALMVIVATFAFSAAASAQVVATAGPLVAPPGGIVWISVSNDTASTVFLSSPCAFLVTDVTGQMVFSPFCAAVVVPIAAGGVHTMTWNMTGNFGPVFPGIYFVNVLMPGGGTTVHPINIVAGEDAGVAQLGALKIGTTRSLGMTAPSDAGFVYVVAAAFATGPPIITCNGAIPLAFDALLTLSLDPTNGIFAGNLGLLDGNGRTTAPTVATPNLPALIGLNFWIAGVSLDTAAACPVLSISPAMNVVII